MRILVVATVAAGLAVSACQKKPETATTTVEQTTTAAAAPAQPTATAPAPAAADAAPTTNGPKFDKASVPVSTVALGAFPYLALPTGYVAGGPETLDLARFPVWVGDHFEWIEGKVYQANIEAAEGKTFSKYELQRNVESLIAQAGGKKIVEVQLPSDFRGKLDPDARQVDKGLGDIISNPVVVFLIRRADKDIWVNFVASTSRGSWAVVETQPFVASAKLLPPAAN